MQQSAALAANPRAIFAPFLAVMLLPMTVWFYMYSRRIPLIQRSSDFLVPFWQAFFGR